jgi:hypothetical protein
MATQTAAIEFELYTMPIDGELFKVAMPHKGNPEFYGLRLIPIDPSSLPELFVWCYYDEEEKALCIPCPMCGVDTG